MHNHVTHVGSEQNVIFKVRVTAKVRGTTGTPTGTVTIEFKGTVLCTIVLSSKGEGTCSPSPSALPARRKFYPVNALYSGNPAFTLSKSGARHMRVLS